MDPKSMEKAMLKNMITKTGRSIEDWVSIIEEKKSQKNIVKFLKEEHLVGHFYAHLIAKIKINNY